MKLIIDIDDEQVLFDIKNRGLEAETETDKVIINALYNGITLDDVKAEMEKAKRFHVGTFEDDNPVDYGIVEGFDKAIEILDNIGKADFPQAKDIEPTVKGFVNTMDILDRLCEESEKV